MNRFTKHAGIFMARRRGDDIALIQALIRTALEQRAAAVELRRLFQGIGDIRQARECVRAIAGWKLNGGPRRQQDTESARASSATTLVASPD